MTDAPLTFVGRTHEMALLTGAIEQACGGGGSLWFLSGEPGIGKSQLAEEVSKAARDNGMRTLWGRCWEAGGAPAYWPWIQVLRALLRTTDPAQYDAHEEALAQILPELTPEVSVGDTGLDAEQARFRLMDAVASIIVDSCRRCPLLIVLEDLHTADESTLVLLDFLSAAVRSHALVVVGTFRPVAPKDNGVGTQLLRTVRRGTHLSLQRLRAEDVSAFARSGGTPLDEAQSRALQETTEGHPLFMVEVARLWRSQMAETDTRPVPDTVRAAIEERLNALTPSSRIALERGAIVGREFDVELLRSAFDDPDGTQPECFGDAIDAAMLVEISPDRYRFSHFLIREVLYDALAPPMRAAAHDRIATALSTRPPAGGVPPWSAIAHHLKEAGPERASEAARAYRQAGAHSMTQFAFSDAIRAFEEARARWAIARQRGEVEEIELSIDLGRAQIHAGRIVEGKQTCLDAAKRARAVGDAMLFARAALERGTALMFAQIDDRLVSLLEEALSLLGSGDSALRARVIARLAAARQPARDPKGPFQLARDGIAMARRVGDPIALLDTFRNGGSALVDLGRPEERLALDLEHAALASQLDNEVELLRATMRSIFDYAELGRLEEARRAIQKVDDITADLGHAFYRWRGVAVRAADALWRGDFVEAAARIEETAILGERGGDPNAAPVVGLQQVRLLRARGEVDLQRPVIEALERRWQEWGFGGTLMNAVIGAEHVLAGRHDEGLRRYDPAAVGTALDLGDRSFMRALSYMCVAAKDSESAKSLYDGARAYQDMFVSGGSLFMTIDEPMHAVLARLARFLGDHAAAQGHYDRAIDLARRAGGRPVTRELETEVAAWREAGESTVVTMEATGESWLVRSGATSFHLKNTKGVRMLAQLLNEPGREFHVLELAGGPESKQGVIDRGDAGEFIDDEARRKYQARIEQLRHALEDPEVQADPTRTKLARDEVDFLTHELSRAVGLGGRERRAAGAAERARVNVQRRVRDALERIEAQNPDLAARLRKEVSTGTFCAYEPGSVVR